MIDWKGTEVRVTIFDETGVIIEQRIRLLDTDTMSDLFTEFPPNSHHFTISMARPHQGGCCFDAP